MHKTQKGSTFSSRRYALRPCCLGSGSGKQFWGYLRANLPCLQQSCKEIGSFLVTKCAVITKTGYFVTLHIRLTFPNVHLSLQGITSTASTHQQHTVWTKWPVSSKSQLARACSHMSSQSLSPLAAATAVAWDGSLALRDSWQGCGGDQWDVWCLSAPGQILKDFFSFPLCFLFGFRSRVLPSLMVYYITWTILLYNCFTFLLLQCDSLKGCCLKARAGSWESELYLGSSNQQWLGDAALSRCNVFPAVVQVWHRNFPWRLQRSVTVIILARLLTLQETVMSIAATVSLKITQVVHCVGDFSLWWGYAPSPPCDKEEEQKQLRSKIRRERPVGHNDPKWVKNPW